jgi:REP element-mobilizing transposase RayT
MIFEQEEDYVQFLDFLQETKSRSECTLYAYCLLGNHVHLLIKEGSESISLVFKRLGTSYAQWFNRKYERSGHLFQNRFRSYPVEDDAYFLTVLLYLYHNPLKARISLSAVDYKWSSRRFLGKLDGLIDEKALLEIVSLQTIVESEARSVCQDVLDEPRIGRRAAYSDKTVSEKLSSICNVNNSTEFQNLPREEQVRAVAVLRTERVPIRQIARLTGLSRGVIEYWGKK